MVPPFQPSVGMQPGTPPTDLSDLPDNLHNMIWKQIKDKSRPTFTGNIPVDWSLMVSNVRKDVFLSATKTIHNKMWREGKEYPWAAVIGSKDEFSILNSTCPNPVLTYVNEVTCETVSKKKNQISMFCVDERKPDHLPTVFMNWKVDPIAVSFHYFQSLH
jgi:hypothetical protein